MLVSGEDAVPTVFDRIEYDRAPQKQQLESIEAFPVPIESSNKTVARVLIGSPIKIKLVGITGINI